MTASPAPDLCNQQKFFQRVGTAPGCHAFGVGPEYACIMRHMPDHGPGALRLGRLLGGRMTAVEILERFLDAVGKAVVDGRLEVYAQHVILPFVLETASATLTVATLDDLAEGFDTYGEMLADLGVTSIQRKVIRAFAPTPGRVHGQYTTRLMAGNVQVAPMFWSQTQIDLIDGVWKSGFIRNTTTDGRWPVMMPNTYTAPHD